MNLIKHPILLREGLIVVNFPLPEAIKTWAINQKWKEIDDYFLSAEKTNGALFTFMQEFAHFNHCEHIIAIRSAPDDEDGIWHDDGSRLLGYSLSLNLEPSKILGGELRFRTKGDESYSSIAPLKYGQMAIFLSGLYGYEHMVTKVERSKRAVVAGWCSLLTQS